MRIALLAGLTSLTANLFILLLSVSVPFTMGFRPLIILQIAFWTFFATIGATVTMTLLQKRTATPVPAFVMLGCIVFSLSLIPIYLHAGILHDFPSTLSTAVVHALVVMHIVDSLIISGILIAFTGKVLSV